MALTFDYYFSQLRKKEEHRARTAEVELRRRYRVLLKDTKNFLADEYFRLADEGKLTYEIMRAKGLNPARLLDEMTRRLSGISQSTITEIQEMVADIYELGYNGMIEAIQKSNTSEELRANLKGLKGVQPETVKANIENPVAGLTLSDTLEKNRQNIIWNIKKEIGIGLSNGDRYETMAKRIATSLDGDYKKAIRIVRTEAARAQEAGHLASAKEINNALEDGVTDERLVKTWKTMRDGAVRDTHQPMNGITVAMDEDFILPSGATAPAPKHSGVAAEDINCRCFVKYELMNSEEFEKATGKQRPVTGKQKQAQKLEQQENDIINEKAGLLADQSDLSDKMSVMEAVQYENIWKNPVTVKDYEAKKDKIQAKRDYFEEQWKKDGDDKWVTLTNRLDHFVADGEDYLKLKHKYDAVSAQMTALDDDLKEVRLKLMKAKGIDPDKLKAEIADLQTQVNALSGANKKLTIKSKISEYDEEYVKAAYKGAGMEYDDWYFKNFKNEPIKNLIEFEVKPDKQTAFKNALKKAVKADAPDTTELTKLQKALADKQDELEAIIKRYGLEDDKFTQARKDAAYWFKDRAKGDSVMRPYASNQWLAASYDERYAAWDYTAGSGKFNRPLRGYEGSWYNFKGVGNVDLDYEGAGSEIKALTEFIDRCEFDFDIWLNRGVSSSGGASFLGIDEYTLRNASEDELKQLLIGRVRTDDAFMSTGASKGDGFSGELIMNIYAPKGTKMIYCEPFSNYGHGAKSANWNGTSSQSSYGYEFECLLQRGTQFKITKVEKSGYTVYIDCDVVGQSH